MAGWDGQSSSAGDYQCLCSVPNPTLALEPPLDMPEARLPDPATNDFLY